MQVLADDLCQAIEGFHSKPLRVLLRGAAIVLPSFRDRDGKLRYGYSLLAVFHIRVTAEISDQHYFLHLLLLLLLCGLTHKLKMGQRGIKDLGYVGPHNMKLKDPKR